MWSIISNLLLHKQMVFGEGNIEIFGQPIVLSPLLIEVGVLKELAKTNNEKLIYYAAKSAGHEWFKGMYSTYGMKPKDIMEWGPKLISLGGWGLVKPFKVELGKAEFDFTLLNSTIAKAYGSSTKPVDHYFRGLVTGAWENAVNQPLEGIETECIASGAKVCKFKLRPREGLDYSDPLVKEQLNLPETKI